MKPITLVVGAAVLLASAGMVRVAWAAGCLNMVPCSDPAFPQEGLTCDPSGETVQAQMVGQAGGTFVEGNTRCGNIRNVDGTITHYACGGKIPMPRHDC